MMSRDTPCGNDSGWVFAEDDYRGHEGVFQSVYEVALLKMSVFPFLALPETTVVHVRPRYFEVCFEGFRKSSQNDRLFGRLVDSLVGES